MNLKSELFHIKETRGSNLFFMLFFLRFLTCVAAMVENEGFFRGFIAFCFSHTCHFTELEVLIIQCICFHVDLVFKEFEVLITLCISNDYYMDKRNCNETKSYIT
jgi:hypothetical protein